jgi:L-aspartate oxidase
MIIIGAGVAGMMAALAAAPAPVSLLTAGKIGEGAASQWSQGGIAAAIGADDHVDLHIADTLAAGHGLCDPAVVSRIIKAGPEIIATLEAYGVRFDRTEDGTLARGLEAAHSRQRILHGNGDATGAEIMRALMAAVRATPSIQVIEQASVRHIFVEEGRATGILAATPGGPLSLADDQILLATGGIGGLFAYSTNPESAIGQGLMLAQSAGAKLADLEFIQFHPTALAIGTGALKLISEAVRGEGAVFIDETGTRFMDGADLAPRDVVARAAFDHLQAGHQVFLDTTSIGARFTTRFPAIAAICAQAGIDPVRQPIPVRPAAHYHMGGVAVDTQNESSISGLFAAGEVARTGLHGANRLASNSLLEAAICGRDAGRVMAARTARPARSLPPVPLPAPMLARPALRDLMTRHLGVLRDAHGLAAARAAFSRMASDDPAARLCLAIAEAAAARTHSVGAHTRRDDAGMRRAA